MENCGVYFIESNLTALPDCLQQYADLRRLELEGIGASKQNGVTNHQYLEEVRFRWRIVQAPKYVEVQCYKFLDLCEVMGDLYKNSKIE